MNFAYVSFPNCRQRRYKAPYVCELFLCSVINLNQCIPFYIIRSNYISFHSYVNNTLTRKLIPYNITCTNVHVLKKKTNIKFNVYWTWKLILKTWRFSLLFLCTVHYIQVYLKGIRLKFLRHNWLISLNMFNWY